MFYKRNNSKHIKDHISSSPLSNISQHLYELNYEAMKIYHIHIIIKRIQKEVHINNKGQLRKVYAILTFSTLGLNNIRGCDAFDTAAADVRDSRKVSEGIFSF